MSDVLSRLDFLKKFFLENLTDDAALLETHAQLDELEETTVDSIETSLISSLKRSILKQQLDDSKHVTDT